MSREDRRARQPDDRDEPVPGAEAATLDLDVRYSVRRRVAIGGFAIIAVLVLALDLFIYLSLRDQLEGDLRRVLVSRATFAVELARELDPPEVQDRLRAQGIRAEIDGFGDTVFASEPAAIRFEGLPPPGSDYAEEQNLVGYATPLPQGGRVIVYASKEGVDQTLRRVLVIAGIGTGGVLVVAALTLWRMAGLALRPLEKIAVTAQRIAGGRRLERLTVDHRDPELRQVAQAFNGMIDALEEAVEDARSAEARSQRFLADAAHQLRTPVAAMRASVDALIRERDSVERERLLDNLLRETARVSRLVASLLRIARLDRGETAEREPVAVTDLVADEVGRARSLAPHLRIDLDVDGAPDERLLIGRAALGDALSNLLDNARAHAESRIEVGVTTEADEVLLTVADDGPGVEPGAEERVFERFVSYDGGGSGLGLPIARSVVRAHGGDVRLEDGAFVIRLPRASAAADADASAAERV